MNQEFNLLWEPWIRVFRKDGTVEEVSLSEALLHAEQYVDLAGELPTQDIAILRQMLALLYAVFLREDENGVSRELASVNEAYDRWYALWKKGRFPEKSLNRYFHRWNDRFYLFDDERPFGQVKEAKRGTEYSAAKLNGEISESANTNRLFPLRCGEAKEKLNFPEAARWLIHINAFDDASGKPPRGSKLPSVGVAWLGKLGLIQAVGETLFETLMLNLVMAQDGIELWKSGVPNWELDTPRSGERTEIPMPENPAALLTLQSRRLLLQRNGEWVTKVFAFGGDFFPREGAFSEQMTVWKRKKGKRNQPDTFLPKEHEASRQMWRDFSSIVAQTTEENDGRLPGVVNWVKQLRSRRKIDEKNAIRFQTISIQYKEGTHSSAVDIFGDTLAFHVDILTQFGKECRFIIMEEIRKCDSMAKFVETLVDEIEKASGLAKDSPKIEIAKKELYFRLDEPFRLWLETIDPEDMDQQEAAIQKWRENAKQIAFDLGRELINQAGPKAIFGCKITLIDKSGKAKGPEQFYSAAKAWNHYQNQINKLFGGTEG